MENKKYQITDFYYWEKPLIEQLEKEGKFIYMMRDTGGYYSTIEKNVVVNRIGYIITNEELPLEKYNNVLDFRDLEKLGYKETFDLKTTEKDMTEILAKAKEEYDSKEPERQKIWNQILEEQNKRLERSRYYNLFKDYTFVLKNGYTLIIQNISPIDEENTKQDVLFFIRNPKGKIVLDSTHETFKFNEKKFIMIRRIEEKYLKELG